ATPTNPFQTIERQDIGLTLKVKPRVSVKGIVHLDIDQEVSSVAPTAFGASDLITNKRAIKTKVSVTDGNIVILGGLIDDNVQSTDQGIPGLSEIPLLGNLFKGTRNTSVKRNLMVFIRPRVLKDEDGIVELSRQRYERMQEVQNNVAGDGLRLIPEETAPVLPEHGAPNSLPPIPPNPFVDEAFSGG
ncbi:MAG: type II secretion system protein GspD, partial [Gammaproteobacteria bacterium]